MYTLEDDEETSTRMRQRDYYNSPYAVQAADTQAANPSSQPVASPSAQEEQITSLGQTPATTVVPNGSAKRRLAIAALIVACASVFVTSMDETVVVTALPKIIADPGINIPITQLDHAAWIISAYLLGFVIAMPLMGRVSDIFGRRRIMLLCLSIFGLGSVLCALAPALGQTWDLSFLDTFGIDTSSPGLILLISARFIQAIGGGAVVPVAMAIVSDYYGQQRLGVALGIIGAVTEAGGVVGPLYGALLVQTLGWTYIFYLNVPIVLALMLGVWFLTPKNQRLQERIDWLGAFLLGVALTCLSLGLAQQGTDLGAASLNAANTPQNNPVALIIALISFILFILVERIRHWRVLRISLRKKPHVALVLQERWAVIDLSLFKRLTFSASSLVSLLVGAALIIAMADIPLFVDTVFAQQISQSDLSLVSGLALLRMTAMIPVGAILGGWLCSRLTCRFIGVLGLLFTAAGFFMMSRWPSSIDWTQITISTMIAGLGFGLVVAPISTTAINSVRSTQAGMGSAVITALRMVGMILGLAALTSWGLAYFKQLAGHFRPFPFKGTQADIAKWTSDYAAHAVASAHTVYTSIFFVTMILCLVAVVPAIFLWGRKPPVDPALAEGDVAQITQSDSVQALASEADQTLYLSGPSPVNHNGVTEMAPAVVPSTVKLPELDENGNPLDDLNEEDDPLALRLPPAQPTVPIVPGTVPVQTGNNTPNRRKRTLLILIAAGLLLLLLAAGLTTLLFWNSGSNNATATPVPGQATVVSGPRMIQLAFNNVALTSVFTSQLGNTDNTLSDIQAKPLANDQVQLNLSLNLSMDGFQRTLPVELDTKIGLDNQQNLQLTVLSVKRDGIDAGPQVAASMQTALNKMMTTAVMPTLRQQLKGAQLISVHTTAALSCGAGQEMLVMLIKAPPVAGIPTQPTPTALCFTQPVDLNKLLG